MTLPKISIQQVGKVFGEGRHRVEALKDISLDIADNEFVTFVGASGCGKSTLLRIIGGLRRTPCRPAGWKFSAGS